MELSKYILPVVAGAMSGMVLITFGVELVIHKMYPDPSGADVHAAGFLAKYVLGLPTGAFVAMLVNYGICSFAAGIISTVIAKRERKIPAIVSGVLLTLAGLYYVIKMPYPMWFAVVSLLVYLPFTLLGYTVARKKQRWGN